MFYLQTLFMYPLNLKPILDRKDKRENDYIAMKLRSPAMYYITSQVISDSSKNCHILIEVADETSNKT